MWEMIHVYWPAAALAAAAWTALTCLSAAVAVAVAAFRHPQRVREALRSVGRMFTD